MCNKKNKVAILTLLKMKKKKSEVLSACKGKSVRHIGPVPIPNKYWPVHKDPSYSLINAFFSAVWVDIIINNHVTVNRVVLESVSEHICIDVVTVYWSFKSCVDYNNSKREPKGSNVVTNNASI